MESEDTNVSVIISVLGYIKQLEISLILVRIRLEQSISKVIMSRRYLECAVFVGAWMACGWAFGLDGFLFQVVGAVMGLFFQLLVARRPIAQVWVRDALRFRLDRWGILLAVALAILAGLGLFLPIQPHRWLMFIPVVLCCMTAALPSSFAIREQQAARFWQALPSFGIAALIGCAAVMGYGLAVAGSMGIVPGKLLSFVPNFSLMFIAGFLIEEVVFRGVLDSHVAPSTAGHGGKWSSAIFIAVIWTLWHLPSDIRIAAPGQLTPLLVFRSLTPLVAVPLSFCWRRSGTLVLPAAAHALINAYRASLPF